jgi:hypothetical protein
MAYNHKNRMRLYKNIVKIVEENYIDGVTTYKGIYRAYVYPVYPISYTTFLKIINTPLKHIKNDNNTNS